MKKCAFVILTVIMMLSLAACSDKTAESVSAAQKTKNTQSPSGNQKSDTAYNLDNLIEAVKKAGCISGDPASIDVKDIGAEKGIAYGNVVFLQYDPYTSNAYFDAYDANQVILNGKAVEIAAINGPYFMLFLDGNVDQSAVKAFYSLGFGS